MLSPSFAVLLTLLAAHSATKAAKQTADINKEEDARTPRPDAAAAVAAEAVVAISSLIFPWQKDHLFGCQETRTVRPLSYLL